MLQRGGQPLLQVDEGLAAPVMADGIGEGLSVSRRTMEIDHHDGVAAAGKHLCVPAIGPEVRHAHLRAAVHYEGDRKAPVRLEAPRLHHVAVHRLIVPAAEAELLVLAHVPRGQQIVVHIGEAFSLAAAQRH